MVRGAEGGQIRNFSGTPRFHSISNPSCRGQLFATTNGDLQRNVASTPKRSRKAEYEILSAISPTPDETSANVEKVGFC
jgi:hypothetical protein